ncbi:MAG: alpha/beta hydrolase [Spirochaetia bacterium]
MIDERRAPIVPLMRVPAVLQPYARTVTLPGSRVTLFCYDAGAQDAPGMLLVHGLGDEADSWRCIIPSLAERHRVVAPDLPGFGRSPFPPHGRLTPAYLASVLRELMAFLGMHRVTLVGSSLGAALAQVVALADSELVSRLILVDGGFLARTSLDAGLLFGLVPGVGERRYRRLAGDLDAAYASLGPYYANLKDMPKAEREFLRERVGERVASMSQMRAYFSFFRGFVRWLLFRGRFLIPRARALDIPTLYVWGAQDHIVPVEAAQATRLKHPGAGLAIIPGAGHLPHQETPQEFLRVIGEPRYVTLTDPSSRRLTW